MGVREQLRVLVDDQEAVADRHERIEECGELIKIEPMQTNRWLFEHDQCFDAGLSAQAVREFQSLPLTKRQLIDLLTQPNVIEPNFAQRRELALNLGQSTGVAKRLVRRQIEHLSDVQAAAFNLQDAWFETLAATRFATNLLNRQPA